MLTTVEDLSREDRAKGSRSIAVSPIATILAAYNQNMSAKRYQYRLVETADVAELEGQLRDAGARQWSAVGYGVLPDGRRSVLLERKIKVHDRHRHHRSMHATPEDN